MFAARDAALVLDRLATQQADARAARNAAIGHDAARHRRTLGKLEHLAHFRMADHDFL